MSEKKYTVTCFCGSLMELRSSKHGPFYGCRRWPDCDGRIGAHPNGQPLGVPADKATRQARIRAHEAFDELWRSGSLTKNGAYRWLQEQGGSDHIADMNADECQELIDEIEAKWY